MFSAIVFMFKINYLIINKLKYFQKNIGFYLYIGIYQYIGTKLVSSINHSPIKRDEGRIFLDKSSERLPFEEQAYNSTQLASALMYLLWGEYNKLLPDFDLSQEAPKGGRNLHKLSVKFFIQSKNNG